jgi:type I restriction enzyme, S subunit
MAKLEEVCEILDSMRVPVTSSERKSGIYPYYGANGVQDYVSEYIFDDELVLLAEDGGNFGSKTRPIAYRVSGKCWVNNHAHVLKAKSSIDVDYLCYSLMFYDVSKIISGTTRAKLNQAAMRKMTIPLPPLETQKQIAKTLNTATELITMRKQQLAELDSLIKSTFYDMFGDPLTNEKGWKFQDINDICSDIVDCPHSTPIHSDVPTQHPSIRTSEIQKGIIKWGSMKYVTETEYLKRVSRIKPQENDIIYGREGSYGDAVILPCGYSFCLGQRVMLLRAKKESCHYKYLWYVVRSDYVYNQAKRKNVGATVGHVNVGDIKKFKVPLPPLPLQNKFAEIVIKVEEQKALVQKAFDETQYLFDSLMSEYFE